MSDNKHLRLPNIKKSVKRKGLDGFLITDIHNVCYLTGFTGSSGFCIITHRENIFVTDFRYREQSEQEVKGWDTVIEKGDRIKTIERLVKQTGIGTLGFESSVSFEFYNRLSHMGLSVKALTGLVENSRVIKDTFEINKIKEAVRRAEAAFLEVKPYIREGTRESTIALRLEERLKKTGCRCVPFDIIVASGPNSARPHAKPTGRKLMSGDLVTIDWGGESDGYFSDMTRTFLMKGENDISRKKGIYHVVFEANRKAISSISPGIQSTTIDSASRNYIKNAGYGEFFGHGTGHGVGLQVHEAPRISWYKSERIRKNMVFTIEPGIYIPGLGGVRIEDIVIVGDKKAMVLTSLPKRLEII